METTKNKKLVHLDERVKQVGGTLIIKEAKVEDSGKYLCMVNNSVGGESVETVLTVTAPLSAEIEPKQQIVDYGRPANFKCNFQVKGPSTYILFFPILSRQCLIFMNLL